MDTVGVLEDVHNERLAQDDKWGEQSHPDGRQAPPFVVDWQRQHVEAQVERGETNWRDILHEEVLEAYGAIGTDKALREELIQVAAVAVAWIEAIDRRGS